MTPLVAQARVEVLMTLRRGETLLVTVGIPVAFLIFFSTVHVVNVGPADSVVFYLPGIVSLAIMSTAMVSLGSATGFERGYGVLKRLGTTPLGRPRLLGGKLAAILMVEIVQAAVLFPVGAGLGWSPPGGAGSAFGALGLSLLATAAFGGVGLLLAGVLRAEMNLAAVNGLYLVLLLLGGMVVPLAKLPGALATFADGLPGAALSNGLHALLGSGGPTPIRSWVVLAIWAAVAPAAAALTFRWE